MFWTPYEITLVLHYHSSSAVFPRWDAPIYWPTVDKLIAAGILENGDKDSDGNNLFATTEKGQALVRMWCNTPEPVMAFLDPRFQERA